MPHVTTYDEKAGIIETKLSGTIKAPEIIEIMNGNAALALEHNCYRWINDFSDARYNISFMEVLNFHNQITKLARSTGIDMHRIKRAIVVRQTDEKHRYAANVMTNRGQNLGVFESIGEARAWITREG
ncbi:MAG TPA: hypothetical protein VMT62_02095 [Syntrophorhabdaceae bacterium]|nr:hypothetical protein [Syntrophorhabdaceae bacterium]